MVVGGSGWGAAQLAGVPVSFEDGGAGDAPACGVVDACLWPRVVRGLVGLRVPEASCLGGGEMVVQVGWAQIRFMRRSHLAERAATCAAVTVHDHALQGFPVDLHLPRLGTVGGGRLGRCLYVGGRNRGAHTSQSITAPRAAPVRRHP